MPTRTKRAIGIVPAFNEERHIAKLLAKLRGFEVLVVDDGSTDSTLAIARKFKVRAMHSPINRGVGAALGTGFDYAAKGGYDACVVVNADLQHPPELVGGFLKELDGCDAVLGSRFLDGSAAKMPFLRRAGNLFFTRLLNVAYGTNYTDVTCGMRAFGPKALERLKGLPDGYGVEAAVCIRLRGLEVREKPVPAIYAPGTSKMNLVRTWFQIMREVVGGLVGK